jgi:putative colanic acid biosynthesis acetyltransferase WcaF
VNQSEFSKYKYTDNICWKTRVIRLLWGIVYSLAFRPTPRWLLHEWRSCLLRLFGAKVGLECKISPSAKFYLPSNLSLGDYVAIGDRVDCYCMDKIVIGSKVAVSAGSFLCTGSHDISTLSRPLITKPITVGDHCWICVGVFIGPGSTIGTGSVVGAFSVVFGQIPEWTVFAGNPAVFRRHRVISEII